MKVTGAKTYKNLFFDLDRTLWDYRANSEQTIADLINKYVPELNSRFEDLLHVFYEINDKLWLEYRDGKLAKDVLQTKRFIDTFKHFSVDATDFVTACSNDYIKESPKKMKLFPFAIEMLGYLVSKGYRLFLLTNGFFEVQWVKIRASKIEPYFERMITSEEAKFQKPNSGIFRYALNLVNAEKDNSIMIGDDLDNDIYGAQNFGIDTVFFNPRKHKHNSNPTFEISDLSELKLIF